MPYQPRAEDLVASAVTQAREEHALLNEDWKGLDVKAQGAMAIAGIMMAAMAVALDKLPQFSQFQTLVFRGALLFLMLASVCALISMLLRKIKMPSTAESALEELEELGLEEAGLEERWIHAQFDLIDRYVKTNEAIRSAIYDRGFWLSAAHLTLALATACLFGMFIGLPTGRAA